MKTFLIVIPRVHREFIVTARQPRVGELISSRHPGLFDAETEDGDPLVPHTLQRAMWLIDRPARWFADLVRCGELKAYRRGAEVVFDDGDLRRMIEQGRTVEPADDWCCQIESIEAVTGEIDAMIHMRSPTSQTQWEDRRQLQLKI